MELKSILTESSPKPIGPYSQAIKYGKLLFVSGQIGGLPETGDLISSDVEMQTHQALKNIGAILTAAGSTYNRILKTTILLTDMNHFSVVNKIYASYFEGSSALPARATYAVLALPKNAKIEIEVIAAIVDE